MSGIYIHIPFCKQACTYCNFHFSTSMKLKSRLVESLIIEIHQRADFFDKETISTVYFGGGTPSLLDADELEMIFDTLHSEFNIAKDAEITLEANPDDISGDKLLILKDSGINRLSIGIQSFFDADLEFMNRAHNSREAFQCLELAAEAGIRDINIDLIYGTPSLTDEMWRANLERVTELRIPHLSAYQLTVEPGTALAAHIRKGKIPPLPEEIAVRQFEILVDWSDRSGFEHYEISNLSVPGRRSKHNTSYWQGKPYLGIGPSAHSFKQNTRSWNIANNAIYIKKIASGESPIMESEQLSIKDQYNEYVMTGLRLTEGVIMELIIAFGKEFAAIFEAGIASHLESGKAQREGNRYYLTRAGRIFADRIASDCFAV